MTPEIYYIIEPKTKLKEILEGFESEFKELLFEKKVWANPEADRSGWDQDAHALRIKLLFLAFTKSDYSETREIEFLFNGRKINEALFDSYWELHRFELDEHTTDAEKNISMDSFNEMSDTGNPLVDAWIQQKKKG